MSDVNCNGESYRSASSVNICHVFFCVNVVFVMRTKHAQPVNIMLQSTVNDGLGRTSNLPNMHPAVITAECVL